MTTNQTKTVEELKASVKVVDNENGQISIYVGKFRVTLAIDAPNYYSLDNVADYSTLYGQFLNGCITVNTFTNGKIVKEGKSGEVRTVTFHKERRK